MNDKIKEAIKVIKQGGIVIFPTDTAFGIGCRVDSETAVKRLFRIRKRPENKPTPILVSGLQMAKYYSNDFSENLIKKLVKPYWPGALTIVVLNNKNRVPNLVRGGGSTVGIRMPDDKDILDIINGVGVAILGPSANFHGQKTPFDIKDVDLKLIKSVDFVIEGTVKGNSASTVVDTTVKPWKTLRQGSINITI